jgi:Fe(3+) dicitrate transport protein
MKPFFLAIAFIFSAVVSFAQIDQPAKDTITLKMMDSITVATYLQAGMVRQLPQIQDHYVFSGKKAVVFQLDQSQANLAGNVSRQFLAQIPGLNIWEMDGAGTQLNIGSRSTDMHRSIEMNKQFF